MPTTLFVARERAAGEARVAAIPETVRRLATRGFRVVVEEGAGERAGFPDRDFVAVGAELLADPAAGWGAADLALVVAPPPADADARLRPGAVLAGLLAPWRNAERIARWAERGVTALALELVPRITRAQAMDALTSQASVAGYKAALLGAARCTRMFPLLMTAAGTVRPARVVVLGAGVAGLQALATARRLGALVEVSDVRPAAREEAESLGGRFIEIPELPSGEGTGGYARELGEGALERQRAALLERLRGADVVIAAAAVPGRPAPVLLTAAMVAAMPPGAVVVDLAAAQGGNCALARIGEEVQHGGVLVLAPADLAASVPGDASALYARNLLALVEHLCASGAPRIDPADEITGAMLLSHDGTVRFRDARPAGDAAAAGAEDRR